MLSYSLVFVEAISEIFPEAKYQRCMVHFMRNVLCNVPRTRSKEADASLKAVFAQEDKDAYIRKATEVAVPFRKTKLGYSFRESE